jgi:hypothetical protein
MVKHRRGTSKLHHHKIRQVCVWGPTDVGKSTFVDAILANLRANNQVFEPHTDKNGPSPMTWSNWNEKTHTICLDHEFRIDRYDAELLKKLLEGNQGTINVKYEKKAREFSTRCPMIFLSNYDPLEDIKILGILIFLIISSFNI